MESTSSNLLNFPTKSLYFTPEMKELSENIFKVSTASTLAFTSLTALAAFTGASLLLPTTLGFIGIVTMICSKVFINLNIGYAEQQYRIGKEKLSLKKDKEKDIALAYYKIAAKLGHVKGSLAIGNLLSNHGGYYQCNKAVKIYKKLAITGNAKAQLKLFFFFKNGWATEGRGDLVDKTKQIEWLAKAAAQGNGQAQFFLGRIYQSGEAKELGYAKNIEKAKELFLAALEQEDGEAKEALKNFDSDNLYKYND